MDPGTQSNLFKAFLICWWLSQHNNELREKNRAKHFYALRYVVLGQDESPTVKINGVTQIESESIEFIVDKVKSLGGTTIFNNMGEIVVNFWHN